MEIEIVSYEGKLWSVGEIDTWFDGEDDHTSWELIPYGWEGEKDWVGPTEWRSKKVVHKWYEEV